MNTERRRNEARRNAELRKMLNLEQQVAMYTLGSFGWSIWFVRKEPLREPQVMLCNGDDYALLSSSGDLIERPAISLRGGATPLKARANAYATA